MKRARQLTRLVLSLFIMTATLLPVRSTPDAVAQTASAGYLENVTFEKLTGKERVTLTVSKQSGVTVENLKGNAVLVRLDNLFVPEGLRRSLDDPSLSTVVRVTPVQKTAEGRSWVLATIDLKQKVPYMVRQEGMNVLIDFNVSSVASSAEPQQEKQPLMEKTAMPSIPVKDLAGGVGSAKKGYTGSRISIDVQDADIKKGVFPLLAELGNVSIVSGDDVKGTVTLKMSEVPWDQALDTVLEITGLGKKQTGNVITVMNMEKIKKEETDRMALEKARRDEADRIAQEQAKKDQAEQLREQAEKLKEPLITRVVSIDYNDAKKLTENIRDFLPKDKEGKSIGSVKVDDHSNALIIQATRQDMTRLLPIIERIDKPTAQILIKANIVETTKDTARNLGVQWGGVWGQKIGSQGLYVTPGGVGGTAVPPGSAFNGSYSPTSGTSGIAGQGFGVNFPAAAISSTASASLGLMFGTIGGNILEVQLQALQQDGKLNILSSPSITTLDNQMAFTENGDIVPYATTETSGGTLTRSIKKEEATLRLEIVPHVIDGKNLKMKIVVKKNEVDPSRNVDGNPYIIKKQTETNLIAQDGETIVISGLTKQKKNDQVSGVPGLKDIPVLGWLFKGESKSETMEEVLIFITPTIIKPQELAGIQTGP
jgi:type IV pilus assembly protein PilQ